MAAPAAAPAVRFVAQETWHRRHAIPVALAVVLGGTFALVVAGASLIGGPSGVSPTAGAGKVIPAQYLGLYIASAATCPGLRWTLLAAVGDVESGHGANMGPSSAGALGPMQFLPATFAEYAPGADPTAIMDPAAAIPAAAAMLCRNGVVANPTAALAAYGAAVSAPTAGAAYAATVLDREQRIVASGPALIGSPGVTLSDAATFDAASSGLDPRLVALLQRLGASVSITVGTLRTGHTVDVTGPGGEDTGRVSNHTYGRAADITTVAGQPVNSGNLAAHQLVAGLAALQGPERPTEVGSPFADIDPSPRWFAETDHVHVGYDA